MALSPIAFIAINYRDFKNWWLKAYEPSTTTPKTMALDSAGVVTVAKLELNKDGFLESAGGALVIPYIDGAYDAWLFPTEAEADANDTTNAERVADNITGGLNQSGLDDALVNDLSQAYEFATVAAYQSFSTVFPVGKVVHLLDKGASYTVIDGTGSANSLDIIASGLVSQSIDLTDKTDPISMGILPDGSDSTLAVANYLTINQGIAFPEGTVYITSLPDLATINGGSKLIFKGQGIDKSTLEVLEGGVDDVLFDNFLVGVEFLDFQVKQVDSPGGNLTIVGKCFDSSASGAAFVQWDNIRTFGFDTVGEVRQSVWCTIGFMECKEYGLKPLSFVKTLKDGSPPTNGWNIFPGGWFNNSLTVENYLCRNGTNGPVFEGSSISIDTLTTEGLSGDGLFIRGNAVGDKSKLVKIANLYQENIVGTSIVVQYVNNLLIDTHFTQGKVTPSTAILNCDEAKVEITRSNGQDFYVDGAILNNNSELLGEVVASFVGGSRYVVDATSLQLSRKQSRYIKKWSTGSIPDTFSFTCTDALPNHGNYSVIIGVVYDGAFFEVQSWTIWVPDGGTEKIMMSTNGATRNVGLTKSGADLIITNNQTGGQPMVWTVTVTNVSSLAIDGDQ